jgi:glucose-6-phosphate isomerase
MPAFHISPGPLSVAFDEACARLDSRGFADALWQRRLDAWAADAATQQKIANRLGWLGALDFITPQLPRLRAFTDTVRGDGTTDVVLLGMGGSSLAPEVLHRVLGVATGYPRFRMLDSVDPDAVDAALDHAGTSVFIFASKSGSTIEPNVMAAEARRRVSEAGHASWASRFIAITDENTALHQRAAVEGFRDIFVNPADIGGRYSALSFFGMVPAALMGVDVDAVVNRAREMESACRAPSARENPGLALGALMAAGARTGRDKLTLLLPDGLQSFGLWVEQLVAESTGKDGKGVVPITGERPAATEGEDRIVVSISLGAAPSDGKAAALQASRAAAVPLIEIDMADAIAIGAEFLRWQVATAAAGWLMEINPFDEPNVQQAKDATRALLDSYASNGSLPRPEPHASLLGARLTLSSAAEEHLAGAAADEFIRVLKPPDYFGLLAYLPPDEPSFESALQEFRTDVRDWTGCATMLGYGPRYLHSTGQLHKGGANNGVFVVITTERADDLAIPGETFSFGVLEMAQALGDFQSLDRTGRRALHVHLPKRDAGLLREVTTALLARRVRR